MLMTRERRSAIRTQHGWAISVLQEAGAIRECEEHGWRQDRADPHARDRGSLRGDARGRILAGDVEGALAEVLDSIGDDCPECPAE